MDAGTTDETVIWLQLARCEGVGAVTCNRLLAAHGSPLAALEVVRRHPAADGTQRRVPDRREMLRELAALADLGGHLLVSGRAHYPDSLRSLPDAPPVLSVRGDPGLLRHPGGGDRRCPQRQRQRLRVRPAARARSSPRRAWSSSRAWPAASTPRRTRALSRPAAPRSP